MTDDLHTIHSYERFTGDHAWHHCENPWEHYVKSSLFKDRKVLRKMRRYVKKIAEIPFDKFVGTHPLEDDYYEECLDCGGTVGETCSKCRPSHFCHYCGGYDHNFLRNEKFPCIAFCTPSSRLIRGHQIRPRAVFDPYRSLHTISHSEGIHVDGYS